MSSCTIYFLISYIIAGLTKSDAALECNIKEVNLLTENNILDKDIVNNFEVVSWFDGDNAKAIWILEDKIHSLREYLLKTGVRYQELDEPICVEENTWLFLISESRNQYQYPDTRQEFRSFGDEFRKIQDNLYPQNPKHERNMNVSSIYSRSYPRPLNITETFPYADLKTLDADVSQRDINFNFLPETIDNRSTKYVKLVDKSIIMYAGVVSSLSVDIDGLILVMTEESGQILWRKQDTVQCFRTECQFILIGHSTGFSYHLVQAHSYRQFYYSEKPDPNIFNNVTLLLGEPYQPGLFFYLTPSENKNGFHFSDEEGHFAGGPLDRGTLCIRIPSISGESITMTNTTELDRDCANIWLHHIIFDDTSPKLYSVQTLELTDSVHIADSTYLRGCDYNETYTWYTDGLHGKLDVNRTQNLFFENLNLNKYQLFYPDAVLQTTKNHFMYRTDAINSQVLSQVMNNITCYGQQRLNFTLEGQCESRCVIEIKYNTNVYKSLKYTVQEEINSNLYMLYAERYQRLLKHYIYHEDERKFLSKIGYSTDAIIQDGAWNDIIRKMNAHQDNFLTILYKINRTCREETKSLPVAGTA